MNCKQCNKGTCVLVTTHNEQTRVRERRGIFISILLLPVSLLRWIFRHGVKGGHEQYNKETKWKCNYCGAFFEQENQ